MVSAWPSSRLTGQLDVERLELAQPVCAETAEAPGQFWVADKSIGEVIYDCRDRIVATQPFIKRLLRCRLGDLRCEPVQIFV